MKNYIQSGDVITVAAPADVLSGEFVAVGSLFGVAQASAVAGDDVALATRGVFELVVANGAGATVGTPIYFGAGMLTVEPNDGGEEPVAYERAGVAVADAEIEDGAARVKVKLG